MKDLNKYIKKSHLRMVEKFNADLEAFRQETQEEAATLYEDQFTSFTLANVRVENGCLLFQYDGGQESQTIVNYDEHTKVYWEDEIDGIAEWVKFWRKCLNRAKRYWSMDTEKLDAIQNGDIEDDEPDDE